MEKKELCAVLVEYKFGAAAMENNMEILQNIKNRTYDPTILRLGTFPKKIKTII